MLAGMDQALVADQTAIDRVGQQIVQLAVGERRDGRANGHPYCMIGFARAQALRGRCDPRGT